MADLPLDWLQAPSQLAPVWPLRAGFFNPVHPPALAVVGSAGRAYLERHGCEEVAVRLGRQGLQALIVAEGLEPAGREEDWSAAGIAVARSPAPAHELVYGLRRALEGLAPRQGTHGVLVAVHGLGVLLRGPSAVGKSELALDLIARGHRLVADDVVDLYCPSREVLMGECPALLQGYLEVRGLGILDVRHLFGPAAVGERQRVDLLIELERRSPEVHARSAERVGDLRSMSCVLGVALPALTLVAGLGHNLAVLVETVCRDTWLRRAGENAAAAFAARQQAAIHASKRTSRS